MYLVLKYQTSCDEVSEEEATSDGKKQNQEEEEEEEEKELYAVSQCSNKQQYLDAPDESNNISFMMYQTPGSTY